ncbi:hypothetical protein QYE76_004251 [Lolium multiflorum]|uniref:CCHC-type domain-containing protein n=1 Tax=Lolium multiflorum TaxID=4521 RepID=A0AAD8RUA6_LOLMU|nr:hypothetical protein QYE76_004251 [Lolium multiflorum]
MSSATPPHPPGFPLRWQRAGSVESVASGRPLGNDHVSGMGVSGYSSSEASAGVNQLVPRAEEPPRERGRVQDRLVWQQPRPSKKTLWRIRKELQRQRQAGTSKRKAPMSPEMEGLCFNCYRDGHMKFECTFPTVCLRCGEEGHAAKECERPRSPSPEDELELRRQALAKRARRGSPPPRAVPRPQAHAPVPVPVWRQGQEVPPPPPVFLPPMEAWPPLRPSPIRTANAHTVGALDEEVPAPLCVVRRSSDMNDLERRLQFAMVAHVGGHRPAVSCGQVGEALLAKLGIPTAALSVHRFAPEDFLVVFSSEEHRNIVAAAPTVTHGGFSLFFRRWNRQAQASQICMRSRLHLAIEGIPPHAWDTGVVERLLGNSCAIEAVAPETRSRADLALFRLTALTSDFDSVPVARNLVVPEPVDSRRGTPPAASQEEAEIMALQYKVLIHVTQIEEVGVSGPGGPQHRGSGDGLRRRSEEDRAGGNGAAHRRSRSLEWKMGLPDRRGHTTRGGHQREVHGPMAETQSWRLPTLEEPASLVAQTQSLMTKEGDSIPAKAGAQEQEFDGTCQDDTRLSQKEGSGAVFVPLPPSLPLATANEDAVQTTHVSDIPTRTHSLDPEVLAPSQPLSDSTTDGKGTLECMEVSGLRTKDPEEDLPAPSEQEEAPTADNRGSDLEGSDDSTWAGPIESAGPGPREEEFFEVSVSVGPRNQPEKGEVDVARDLASSTDDSLGIGSPLQSFTGPNSQMQMVPVERSTGMTPQEVAALSKIKAFCAGILKALAPPLLKEIESSKLRREAEPFTPRRVTRQSAGAPMTASKQQKKPSAADTALLKALGISPSADLIVREEHMQELQSIFDSPVRDRQLRALAAIFGKTMPTSFATMEDGHLPAAVVAQ